MYLRSALIMYDDAILSYIVVILWFFLFWQVQLWWSMCWRSAQRTETSTVFICKYLLISTCSYSDWKNGKAFPSQGILLRLEKYENFIQNTGKNTGRKVGKNLSSSNRRVSSFLLFPNFWGFPTFGPKFLLFPTFWGFRIKFYKITLQWQFYRPLNNTF